jgi:hypothetical protein
MDTTAHDLARIERRLREARGYSEGYGKLLHHSARKVLAANGFHLPDEARPIPIDADAVERQITRFTEQPASDRRPRSSTAANYAENWRRFARWTRDFLRAEAAGEEDLYLHKLGSRAPKRPRRADRTHAAAPEWALGDLSPAISHERAFAPDAMAMMVAPPPEPEREPLYAYPAARSALAPDDRRVVTVRTSFGPYRIELPANLSAEDAARIARAVLRAID